MRTNIVIDDELIERARKITGIKTKREIIHEALRTLIRMHEQAQICMLRGKLEWEGDLDTLRTDRSHDHG